MSGPLEPPEVAPQSTIEQSKADPIRVECFRDESILQSTASRREMEKGSRLIKVFCFSFFFFLLSQSLGFMKNAIKSGHFTASVGEASIAGRVMASGPPKDPTTLKVFNQGEFMTRIMVKPKSFDLGLGLFEPLFFRLAVYDVANGTKVSEDVSFELNSPQVKNLVPSLARQGYYYNHFFFFFFFRNIF